MSRILGKLFLLLIVAAAGAAGGAYLQKWWSARPERLTGTSDPAPPPLKRSIVSALGRLEPESEIIDVGAPLGRISTLEVQEGSIVEKAAALAYLDTYDASLAARNHAISELDEARQLLAAETHLGDANIDVARATLRHAEEVLVSQIKAHEAAVRRTQAELEEAESDLQRATNLLRDNTIHKSEYDDVALVERQTQESLEALQKQLQEFQDNQRVQVELAEAGVKAAEAVKARQELATRVASREQAVKLAEAQVERTIIRAPICGEVLKVLTHPGEIVGTEPIVKMGDLESMFAVAEVYETDVGLVRNGQKATITSGAFGDTLTGRVERIGKIVYRNDVLAIDPTADADARIIEVRIRLDDSSVAARFNNHQVDIDIHLDDELVPDTLLR